MDRRLGPERRRPAVEFEDLASDIREMQEKDWRPEEIGFFNPNCEEPGPVVTINRHVYYRDVYAFIDRLKTLRYLDQWKKSKQSYHNYYGEVL